MPTLRAQRRLVWSMAFASAVSLASLYYNQPLIGEIGSTLHLSPVEAARISVATQLGYGLGMLFLIPLGDLFERKRLIVAMTTAASLCTLATGLAGSLVMFYAASFAVGLATMAPHLILPFATHLVGSDEKGRVVGVIIGANLLGILGARAIAGFAGAAWGWRAVFIGAAALLAALAIWLQAVLPNMQAEFKGRYRDLLRSSWQIFRGAPVVQEACLVGACFFAAFSVFWSTVVRLMDTPAYGAGSRGVGYLALLGMVGALAMPYVGGAIDKREPRKAVALSAVAALVGFSLLAAAVSRLTPLIVGVLLMDFGVQAAHVTNQARIYGAAPQARSRVNSVYMFCYFMGGALGSYAGAVAWQLGGWPAVCAVGLAFIGIALLALLTKVFSKVAPAREVAGQKPL